MQRYENLLLQQSFRRSVDADSCTLLYLQVDWILDHSLVGRVPTTATVAPRRVKTQQAAS